MSRSLHFRFQTLIFIVSDLESLGVCFDCAWLSIACRCSFRFAEDTSRWEISDDSTTFTVRDVCKDCDRGPGIPGDLMVVGCNASNDHGFAVAQGYLNVLSQFVT